MNPKAFRQCDQCRAAGRVEPARVRITLDESVWELCAAHGDTTAAFVLQHLTSPIPPCEASRAWDRASEAARKAAVEACHGDPWCPI